MKYEINQDVIIRRGKLTGYRGWVAENDNQRMARLGMPYEIIFYDNCPVHSEWMPEEYLMSANDLADLQAENERLKEALRKIAGYWSDNSVKPMSDADSIDYLISVALAAMLESEQTA